MTLKGEWIVPVKSRTEGIADTGFLSSKSMAMVSQMVRVSCFHRGIRMHNLSFNTATIFLYEG